MEKDYWYTKTQQINKSALIRSGGGTGPMKPGNRWEAVKPPNKVLIPAGDILLADKGKSGDYKPASSYLKRP